MKDDILMEYVVQCNTLWYNLFKLRRGVLSMSTVTVRLNEEEERIFKEYARLMNMPLSTLLKQTLEEKLEDEFDMQLIAEYEKDRQNNRVEILSHEEVKNKLGL